MHLITLKHFFLQIPYTFRSAYLLSFSLSPSLWIRKPKYLEHPQYFLELSKNIATIHNKPILASITMRTSNGFATNDIRNGMDFHSLENRQPPPDRPAPLRSRPYAQEYQEHEKENGNTNRTSKS